MPKRARKYKLAHTKRYGEAKTASERASVVGTASLAAALKSDEKSKSSPAAKRRANRRIADYTIAKIGRLRLGERLRKEAKKSSEKVYWKNSKPKK